LQTDLFSALLMTRARHDLPGNRTDWEEVEGCWVLRPPTSKGKPQALVHFIGGAFVGTAPQLFYRLFLETLALRNIMVIATPYQTSFDQLRVADETQFKFDCAYRAMAAETSGLPVYGVGHSQGSLIHLLICTRYTVNRAGNVLLSFNNRPATDTIPLLSPFFGALQKPLKALKPQHLQFLRPFFTFLLLLRSASVIHRALLCLSLLLTASVFVMRTFVTPLGKSGGGGGFHSEWWWLWVQNPVHPDNPNPNP